jgi:GNAT superfamily N-acetyltransferase
MITYQQEFFGKVKLEIETLITKHWEEIALNKDYIKLNPDWEAYQQLEDNGILKIFTVRSDSILIGYFVLLVRNHIHYKDHKFAANDILFLSSEYRKGRVGAGLISFVEKCLKDDGVSVLIVNTKCHKPFDNLLEYLGFTHIEKIYSKLLIKG